MAASREAAARPYGVRGLREVRVKVTHALTHAPSHNREFDGDNDNTYRESLINTTWSPEETNDLDGHRLADIGKLKHHCRSVGHAC